MAQPVFTLASSPNQPMSRDGGDCTKFSSAVPLFCGYLGFASRADFAKFAIDIEFLSVYLHYRAFINSVKLKSVLSALAWLYSSTQPDGSRFPTDNDNENAIPDTLDQAFAKYGNKKDRKDELIGCLLYITDEIFQRAALKHENKTRAPPQAAEITRVYAAFHTNTGWNIPVGHRTTVVAASRQHHPLPMGLRNDCIQRYNEHVCERWNRIWHCFQMMDFYKAPSKRTSLFETGNQKAAVTPLWWRGAHRPGALPVVASRPQKIILQETMAKYTGIELTRDVKCELVLEQGQEDLLDHLNNSPQRAAAKRLLTRQLIHSPGRFKSLNQWIAYISTEMKFKELKVCFDSIIMTLHGEDGPTTLGHQVISSVNNEWTIKEINAVFMTHFAKTAMFSCFLHAGQEPDEIPFTMPPGLTHFLQFDEQNEFGPPNLEPNLSSPQRQSSQVCRNGEPEFDTLSQKPLDVHSPKTTRPTTGSDVPRTDDASRSDGEPKNSQESIAAGGVTDAQTQQTSEVTATSDTLPTMSHTRPYNELGIIEVQSEQAEIGVTEGHAQISRAFEHEDLSAGWPTAHWNAFVTARNKSSTRGASGPSLKTTHLNPISVESLKRIEAMGHGLRLSCKASLDRADAHTFAHTKASSGLSQVITPRDVWELDEFGPGGTRRDRATFIQEEYDGFDVIDNPTEMIAWMRDVIRDVAPGQPAREQSAGDRSQLYSRYKEHHDEMDALQHEEVEAALQFDREMITESGAGTENGGGFGEVRSYLSVALQLLTHYYRPLK
jgi:hypothetical protein